MNKTMKFYDMNYLMTTDLTDDDLYNLLDKHSFVYSVVIEMFHFMNSKLSNEEIVQLCTSNDRWMFMITWSKNEYKKFCNNLIKVYENVFQYSENMATQKAQWFLTQFGFVIKSHNKINNLFEY